MNREAVVAVVCIGLGALISVTGLAMYGTGFGERLARVEFPWNPAAAVLGGLVLVSLGIGLVLRDNGPRWVVPACLVVAIALGAAVVVMSFTGTPRWARPVWQDATGHETTEEEG